MISKKWKVGILGLVLSLGITACGTKPISKDENEAAKELISKMVEASENCAVTSMDCRTELINKVRRGLEAKDWKVIIDTTSQYDREKFMSLSESTITNLLDDKEKAEVKSYMIPEEDKLYTYRLVDGEDWFKHDSKIKAEDISKNLVDGLDWENVEILSIDKKNHTIDGRDNYKLTVKLMGNGTRDLIFESGIRNFYWNTEYGTLDLQDVVMKAEYYVDCETYRVSKLVINFDEMQPVITRQAELGYAGYMDMQFKECQMVYDNIYYEPVKVPKMSFEDKKNTIEVLQEDVVISIEERDNVAQVQGKSRWSLVTKEYDKVAFISGDKSKYIRYVMSVNVSLKDWIVDIEKKQIPTMQENGVYVSHEKVAGIDGFDVYYFEMTYGMAAYARGQVGEEDESVTIYVEEADTDNIEALLLEAIENIKW